jgi:hypothetical protein
MLTLYLPPVLPSQTIISVPLHTVVYPKFAGGALMMLVAVQLSLLGLYLPPVVKKYPWLSPLQIIISLPVHTAFCLVRPEGASTVLVGVQLSVLGLYLPPVFTEFSPPQTIISLPLQTAV